SSLGRSISSATVHSSIRLTSLCSVAELIDLPSEDLIIERSVLDALNRARHVRTISIVNGLERGNVAKALAGEKVGTLIHQDAK
ncbi:MAG: hypothetical protein AAFX94_20765, partial [Myxococcota bacterium]